MRFDFDLSDELKLVIRKLLTKDKLRVIILNKKIKEIINNDSGSIERYKNLRYGLSKYKRVHIDKSFVLVFKYDKTNDKVIFYDFDHHDKIYKKRF